MKKTTYILLGMVMTGFIIIAVMAGLAYCFSQPAASRHWVLDKQQTTVALPSCSVFFLQPIHSHNDELLRGGRGRSRIYLERSDLAIMPVDADTGSLTFPLELKPYLSVVTQGDTCMVCLDLPDEVYRKYRLDQEGTLLAEFGHMELKLPAGVQQVDLNWENLQSELHSWQCDSLSLQSLSSVDLCRSHFEHLYLRQGRFTMDEVKVNHLWIDLDEVYDWKVQAESCEIGIEHLWGSQQHHCQIQRGECKEVRWNPVVEEASLTLSLQQSAHVHFPE